MSKNNQHVSFPVNTLDLTLFAYKSLLFEETSDHNTIEQETAVSREVEGFEVRHKSERASSKVLKCF